MRYSGISHSNWTFQYFDYNVSSWRFKIRSVMRASILVALLFDSPRYSTLEIYFHLRLTKMLPGTSWFRISDCVDWYHQRFGEARLTMCSVHTMSRGNWELFSTSRDRRGAPDISSLSLFFSVVTYALRRALIKQPRRCTNWSLSCERDSRLVHLAVHLTRTKSLPHFTDVRAGVSTAAPGARGGGGESADPGNLAFFFLLSSVSALSAFSSWRMWTRR